ncbi:MAG TPA: immunoglobulin domain-containing protein, partial [Dongiaceae bacterium]|nr:immunoglobulin domain-containing protein [Dongiaceae bacterium]
MRMGNFNWTRYGAGVLAGVATLLAIQVRALDVIDPTGFNYSGATDNSHYDDSYVSANLFDHDVTGLALGSTVSGNEYARSGTGDCYVSFQLDNIYTNIASVFYAQRNGFSANLDKIGIISVWTSPDTAFAAADPGTAPASVVLVTNSNGAQWTEYPLTNVISGQYFLVKLEQTAVGGNPGGSELRFGAALGLAPTILAAPVDKTVYTNGAVHFTVTADGTKPLIYTWKHGSTVLANDARISGADTAQLVISGVLAADAGGYSVTVSNNYGSTNLTATLAIAATPTNA